MKKAVFGVTAALFLGSCDFPDPGADLGRMFLYIGLSLECGKSFEGHVTESQDGDQLWRESRIVMHIAECSDDEIRIPLSVGEDNSRTWVLTIDEDYMTLKHIHLHEDGTEDAVSNYGGASDRVSVTEGPTLIYFPADEYSKALFRENGLDASVENTWVLGIDNEANKFIYRLQRPGRTFQLEFDLSKPLEVDPAEE